MFFRFGAYRAIVSTTVSPNSSRFSSQLPSVRWYGAYCTKHDITCFPGGATLGSVRIPKGVSANGQPLPAGTYTVRLGSESGVPGKAGQTAELSKWCEFVQGGEVKGKELCTVLSASEVGAVVKDAPPASGASKVQMLKGNDYLRVWINRGGTHYLMHLPAAPGL